MTHILHARERDELDLIADTVRRVFGLPLTQAPAATPQGETATQKGHRAGLAAAASMVQITVSEIDGRDVMRSEAYEIARRVVQAYQDQMHRAHQRENEGR